MKEEDTVCPMRNSRELIVDAAQAVVTEAGAAHLTLDAVAARAGISKGGLLYHFPTKEELLKAMLHRRMQHLEKMRKRKRSAIPEGPGREIKAYVLSMLARDPQTEPISGAVLASAAHDPKLLKPLRNDYLRLMPELDPSGVRLERTAVIVLAAHGLRLLEILSLSPFKGKARKRVIEEMLRLADEGIE